MTHHKKLCYGVANLVDKSFTPSHMCDDPLIHLGCVLQEVKDQPTGWHLKNMPLENETSEQKGGMLIRYLWHRGTDSIHEMHDVNTDDLSYRKKSP